MGPRGCMDVSHRQIPCSYRESNKILSRPDCNPLTISQLPLLKALMSVVHLRTHHEVPEVREKCNSTLSVTSAHDGGGWSTSRPGRFSKRNLKVKVKCTLVQALRLCAGRTVHRESRGIAVPFHDHGTRRGEGSASRPSRSLPPGKSRYPLYRRLGVPQSQSGQVRKISPPPGFDSRTVQPVASRYTD